MVPLCFTACAASCTSSNVLSNNGENRACLLFQYGISAACSRVIDHTYSRRLTPAGGSLQGMSCVGCPFHCNYRKFNFYHFTRLKQKCQTPFLNFLKKETGIRLRAYPLFFRFIRTL
ncbi:hypothetical protein B6259_01620 [Ruminococcaceae bacterium CPB6]|nr:hypothetical protein B6259_01620 [Ruminococcaceae bacterium CPB6]